MSYFDALNVLVNSRKRTLFRRRFVYFIAMSKLGIAKSLRVWRSF